MEQIHGHSAACCSVPPKISKGYEEKGMYETIGGLKTYVTGSPSAEKALLVIYDIFGYFPQTLQGADILATSDEDHSYQVFMPDFFEGEPCDISWYPSTSESIAHLASLEGKPGKHERTAPLTDEQRKHLYDWFGTRTPPTAAVRVPRVIADIEAVHGKKTWGAVGFCWGAKVVSLTSGLNTLFKANCQAHPGMIDVVDAKKIMIPTLMLASAEESPEEVESWGRALKAEKSVEIRGDQMHGWMSARGDLEDDKCREAYHQGYETFLRWFAKYL